MVTISPCPLCGQKLTKLEYKEALKKATTAAKDQSRTCVVCGKPQVKI